jgi:hypothetical protein
MAEGFTVSSLDECNDPLALIAAQKKP